MISIIIPTLNEEKVIGRTLQNLRRDLRDFPHQLIVSDGGSKDRTRDIARRYADRVIADTGETKKTIAWGKNRGAEVASGTHLIFIDADVRIPEVRRFMGEALRCFKANPRLLGITAKLRVYPEDETFADRFFFGLVNLIHRLNNNLFHTGSASGEFQMIEANAFRKLGGYREDLAVAEDNEFFYRLSRIGRTLFLSNFTVLHSGRRGHVIGWPRLLWQWTINWLAMKFLKRSASKEWRPIR